MSNLVSIIVNLTIFIILTIGSIVLISFLKFEEKGYKYLFFLYTIFWIPIMLVRSYRGVMQKAIDDTWIFVSIALSIYGFIGVFIRIFADVISFLFRYRKAFLYFSVIAQICLFIPLVIYPSTATNILSSVAIGIGASCIGTYELIFKEQYNQKKSFLTVSILAIPPLLADFLTAPIQSTFRTWAVTDGAIDPMKLRWMWVVSIVFLLICFVMIFFLKEKRMNYALVQQSKQKNHQKWFNINLFVALVIIGSLIAFIRFANSDAIATMHIKEIGKLTNHNTSSYEGYISVIYSLFQLLASILIGTIFIKRMNIISIFFIGIGSWLIFHISVPFITNPIAYFALNAFNGFGYGILYNLVLGIVLKIVMDHKIITKMGIYQSVLSLGIGVSGFFTEWMKQLFPKNSDIQTYMVPFFYINIVLIGVIILVSIGFTATYLLGNKKTTFFVLNKV